MLQQQPGGPELPHLPAQHRENHNRLGVHQKQVRKHLKRPAKAALGQRVGHLEDLRVQHRVGHRVDVRAGDVAAGGVKGDLVDFPAQPRHQPPAQKAEVFGQIVADVLAVVLEAAANPGVEVALGLGLEVDNHRLLLEQLAQLCVAAGLVLQLVVDEHQTHIVRQIGEQVQQSVAAGLVFEQIAVRHLHQRPLAHHGEGVHGLGEGPHVQILPGEAVQVEGLHALGDEGLAQRGQVVLPEVVLLAVEHIAASDGALVQVLLELLQAGISGVGLLRRHVPHSFPCRCGFLYSIAQFGGCVQKRCLDSQGNSI